MGTVQIVKGTLGNFKTIFNISVNTFFSGNFPLSVTILLCWGVSLQKDTSPWLYVGSVPLFMLTFIPWRDVFVKGSWQELLIAPFELQRGCALRWLIGPYTCQVLVSDLSNQWKHQRQLPAGCMSERGGEGECVCIHTDLHSSALSTFKCIYSWLL